MLAAATEYSGPCMCPMWPFQHWRCLKHKEGGGRGEGSRDASAAQKAWKSGGFPHGSVLKKIPTISYSPCFFPLTSTLLFGSALHRNICFLSPVSHPRPPLFSPRPPSRLCHLDPSSCTAEICGRVAAVEFPLVGNQGSGAAS